MEVFFLSILYSLSCACQQGLKNVFTGHAAAARGRRLPECPIASRMMRAAVLRMFAATCTRWPRPDGIKAALVVTSGFGSCKWLWLLRAALAAASGFSCYEWLLQLQAASATASDFCSRKWLRLLQATFVTASGFGCYKRLRQPKAAFAAASGTGCRKRVRSYPSGKASPDIRLAPSNPRQLQLSQTAAAAQLDGRRYSVTLRYYHIERGLPRKHTAIRPGPA